MPQLSSSSSRRDSYSHSTHTISTTALENRLHILRDKSNALSQTLTQRLATSQSGQNLLHIGPSLSTLPPDLHSLEQNLNPLIQDVEKYDQSCRNELSRIVQLGNQVRMTQRRSHQARECADMYHDLLAAEALLKLDESVETIHSYNGGPQQGKDLLEALDMTRLDVSFEKDATKSKEKNILEHLSSLERTAHITLYLIQQLKLSTDPVHISNPSSSNVTNNNLSNPTNGSKLPSMTDPLPQATEKAQFLMKLSNRIRKLESQVIASLKSRMENILGDIGRQKELELEQQQENEDVERNGNVGLDVGTFGEVSLEIQEQQNLIAIGHCLRGLALLGRGKEAESTFARVAVVPIIRSKISMGKLDEGGSRGQCAGLFSLLDDVASTISQIYGNVIRLSEDMFDISTLDAAGALLGNGNKEEKTEGKELVEIDDELCKNVEVDLVTAGVWVPIATALMADSKIQMAIFSPGIATVLQANYTSLDVFLSELSNRLLNKSPQNSNLDSTASDSFLSAPTISPQSIQASQKRIYSHAITQEFSKKWNLPIYYQLRFGESCTRIHASIEKVQREGWQAKVFTGSDDTAESIMNTYGFEVPLFIELYDILLGLWKPDVIIRPLTHRFIRGALQLIGRMVTFVKEGLEGKIQFGGDKDTSAVSDKDQEDSYIWSERIGDVATVAWELTVLESCMNHDYAAMVVETIATENMVEMTNISNSQEELNELRSIIPEVFIDASQEIGPLIETMWNDVIVNILTKLCSAPLSAVKGVAATYRMTNRPPPTQSSPFVSMILRPLRDFDENFSSRAPPQVGFEWKTEVVRIVAEKYSIAVEELLETVKRTEVALKNRKARRMTTGGMSDGEKVKLQLYLDYKEFAQSVSEIGVDIGTVEGVVKLGTLTVEAESLISGQQS